MKKYIVILAFVLGTSSLSACNSKNTTSNEPVKAEQTQSEDTVIVVQGSCDMCKDRIETAAKSVDGVRSATWDMQSNELHLDFDPAKTTIDTISQAIAKAGHDTDKYKTDDTIYNALPNCCKYR